MGDPTRSVGPIAVLWFGSRWDLSRFGQRDAPGNAWAAEATPEGLSHAGGNSGDNSGKDRRDNPSGKLRSDRSIVLLQTEKTDDAIAVLPPQMLKSGSPSLFCSSSGSSRFWFRFSGGGRFGSASPRDFCYFVRCFGMEGHFVRLFQIRGEPHGGRSLTSERGMRPIQVRFSPSSAARPRPSTPWRSILPPRRTRIRRWPLVSGGVPWSWRSRSSPWQPVVANSGPYPRRAVPSNRRNRGAPPWINPSPGFRDPRSNRCRRPGPEPHHPAGTSRERGPPRRRPEARSPVSPRSDGCEALEGRLVAANPVGSGQPPGADATGGACLLAPAVQKGISERVTRLICSCM